MTIVGLLLFAVHLDRIEGLQSIVEMHLQNLRWTYVARALVKDMLALLVL